MKVQEITKKIGSYLVWLLLLILALSVVRNMGRVAMVRSDVEKAKEKVAKIEAENAKLESEVEEAQSDVFIEKQIRDKLGFAKAGEAIVILPDEEILKKLAPSPYQDENSLPDPNWKRWLKLFL